MEQQPLVKKTCPKCSAQDYQFRSRKTIPAKGNEPEAVETKYKCKACQHEWRVRVPKTTIDNQTRNRE